MKNKLIIQNQTPAPTASFSNFDGLNSYRSFLTNIYRKSNGEKFTSVEGYISCIKKSLKLIGTNERTYFSAENITFLKVQLIKLEDRFAFKRNDKSVSDLVCAMNSYIEFMRHKLNINNKMKLAA